MRIIPPLTAVAVSALLFGLIMERDSLMAFARGEDASAGETETAATEAEVATEAEAISRVGVVALRSSARNIDNAVILRGQTRAMREVDVRAETSSTVISEPLRKGVAVNKGDILCELDPGTRPAALLEAEAHLKEAEARVPEAQARIAEAQARLHEAEINLTAASKLSEGGYASETRLAAAQATERAAHASIASGLSGLETTKAGIESARAEVAAAKKEMEHLVLKAPFAGLLESDTAEIGSLLQPGSLCATVIQLDTIKLVGFVPETQVSRVTLGSLAGARLATGQQVQGNVTFISRSADENTRTFEVEITVPNADLAIRDGQTAEIMIGAEGTKAHQLPQSALTLDNAGRLGVRIVNDDQTAGFVPVEMLRDTAEGVWLGGLPEEADVIVVGQDFVTAGVPVEATYRTLAEGSDQ
ncbi:Multidrug transporter MdtA [Tritonibacter multivorans]|uniref:Multidrug transporter MdtA n=1 Tax=Tritonibacter multivorans TaxID=928856 RepID=A0A0P1GHM6_9RHOB|nr:efflux RND transporter periplasmic adaptor subunit [Tritonibacter multivorans]MDA7420498.1 efflux RND transporter periplasmic adaptor subunit [Tritonibacter multivorans]CUH81483.1 Multidrug transporter MdtA [Tritonibacter multivorans]SFC36415.1 membrane fusion protein, multidrug efflux system [Tritonibacter multivorans]